MTDGFYVDVPVVRTAIQGIQDTLDTTDITSVRDLSLSGAVIGHDGLASAFGEFCRRWELGVVHLREDASRIADSLNTAMTTYQTTDDNLSQGFGR